jgi:hypothetical protein
MNAPLLHSAQKLRGFLDYVNKKQNNIHFIMETATDGHLPSLEINISSTEDGCLCHKVHRKLTRNLYLTARSHHHPANKHTHIYRVYMFTKFHLNH